MFLPIFIALTSIVKFLEPKIEKSEWSELNDKLKEKLTPINHHISRSKNPQDIVILGDQANVVIQNFLLEHPEIFEAAESTKKSKFRKHTPKALEDAVKLKNILKKKAANYDSTEKYRKQFMKALRAVSDLREAERRKGTKSGKPIFKK